MRIKMHLSMRAFIPGETEDSGLVIEYQPNGKVEIELKAKANTVSVQACDLLRLLRHLEVEAGSVGEASDAPFINYLETR